MPVEKNLMSHLRSQYGNKKGQSIYYAMEQKAGGSFQGLHSALKKGAFNKNRKKYGNLRSQK